MKIQFMSLAIGSAAAFLLATGVAHADTCFLFILCDIPLPPIPGPHPAPAPLLAAGIPAFVALGGGLACTPVVAEIPFLTDLTWP